MKFIIALAVIALAFAQLTEREAEMIRQTSPSFQVGIHEKFVGKSDWELSRMVMRTIPARRPRMFAESTFELDYTLPESFDSRDKWGASCPTVKEIRNQAQCGSCWAFGAAESSSDRYCIAKGESVKFSAQWLVSCDHTDHGCNGGAMYNVWNYIKNYGIVPNSCLSYKSAQGDVPACPSTCEDGSAPQKYYATSFKQLGSVEEIQDEIYNYGPIEAAFIVYRDFYYYTSGVYHHTSGQEMGGHAIKIIGWGVEDNTPYWTVANSWGYDWGIGGTFKIKRGVDECGIESLGPMAGHF
ncbi:Papain family cysteine protease [Carpediemonas membranifera]|uniref:Papain family cysteine protease n=1 Tax=Carpediemonas membranifera TaxID=201153 RepID=A0A8J6DZF5_9EUKA|nr:Papain family cysteine protease [Carpediemonas membranifera]|eukprot:KAG9390653.1 Papain family cysteine protease [Carpediemonas membranifera]